jgi:hypothetical protein
MSELLFSIFISFILQRDVLLIRRRFKCFVVDNQSTSRRVADCITNNTQACHVPALSYILT